MNSKATTALRIFFGLFVLFFGLNKFFAFLPPFEMSGSALDLMTIYSSSGFMGIIGILEIVAGIALLVNKFTPLALTVLIAIMFNALIFHILHDPANVGGAAFGLILGLANVFGVKERFSSLLSA